MNIYSFVLFIAGTLVFLLPFYKINKWILVIQGIIAIYIFSTAGKMLFAWDDKKIKRNILLGKNRDEFRPDSFEVFMRAPCGRLLVRSVLADLGKADEYKNLLKLKKPFLTELRENCMPVKTVIYINENVK